MHDTITCPVTGQRIEPHEGLIVKDSKGNMWVVHKDAAAQNVRSDPNGRTLNGHKPIFGPDA